MCEWSFRVSNLLNFENLAGSEKGADANNALQLTKGTDINVSLLQLEIVVRALFKKQKFVDYRSSKLNGWTSVIDKTDENLMNISG